MKTHIEGVDIAADGVEGVDWRYIQLGKPLQNCFVESFNSSFRD